MKHKHRKNVTSLFYMAVVTVLLFLALIYCVIYISNENKKELSLSFDWNIDSPQNQEIYVIANSGRAWEADEGTGNQYNFTIFNNSSYPITDWTLSVNIPEGCNIDSTWNGFWGIEEDKLIYEPEEFNKQVMSDDYKTFGLVMYSEETLPMDQMFLDYRLDRKLITFVPFWIILILINIFAVAIVVVHVVDIKLANYSKTHAAYKDLVSESLRTIANIIDTKDEYTKGHSVRVAIYSRMIAKRMGMSEYDQERIYYIGLLHDIGKVGIPASILTKPGRLTDEEFEIIKRHPALGSGIMKDFSSIPGVQNGIRCHHERYDGKGYNEGLKGEEIPLEGRIICVADSYDAMSSKRCYRNALSYEFILGELKRNSGIQFDPDILKHMIALVEEGLAPISDAEMEDYEI